MLHDFSTLYFVAVLTYELRHEDTCFMYNADTVIDQIR